MILMMNPIIKLTIHNANRRSQRIPIRNVTLWVAQEKRSALSRPIVNATHQKREKRSPSSKTIQPLRPRQTQERERRLPFKELRVWDHTARSLQVEPSFAGHREFRLSVRP